MKARMKPADRLTRDERKQITDRVWTDLDKILKAKKKTMADRLMAFMIIACRDEYSLGEKRIRRLYEHLQKEMDRQAENMADTGDQILFENLHTLGLNDLSRQIMEDYAAEIAARRGTIFAAEQEGENEEHNQRHNEEHSK